jgi:signal transduction histidine kinase
VCNWGVGIESDEIDSGLIYNLGYRGRLAQQGFPGTGVGLTDAKRVIEASGGRLEVYSERTGGSEDISRSDLFLTKVVILLPGTDKELPSTD